MFNYYDENDNLLTGFKKNPKRNFFVNEKYYVDTITGEKVDNLTFNSKEAIKAINDTFMRPKRNQLLKDSDWTMLSDSPLSMADKGKMIAYRQALRALGNQGISIILESELPKHPLETK